VTQKSKEVQTPAGGGFLGRERQKLLGRENFLYQLRKIGRKENCFLFLRIRKEEKILQGEEISGESPQEERKSLHPYLRGDDWLGGGRELFWETSAHSLRKKRGGKNVSKRKGEGTWKKIESKKGEEGAFQGMRSFRGYPNRKEEWDKQRARDKSPTRRKRGRGSTLVGEKEEFFLPAKTYY